MLTRRVYPIIPHAQSHTLTQDDYFSMATAKADRARALSARTGPADTWHSDDRQFSGTATFVYPTPRRDRREGGGGGGGETKEAR